MKQKTLLKNCLRFFLKRRIIKLIVLLAILSYTNTYAQDNYNLVVKSPAASQLPIFGNTPISPSTGVPQINIPLGEIISGDIKVPISLSYNASGVRVKSRSDLYGVNWSLNAGGIVAITDGNPQKRSHIDIDISKYTDVTNLNYDDVMQVYEYVNVGIYAQPYSFSYSIPGGSGAFYMDANGTFYNEFEKSIKIDAVFDKPSNGFSKLNLINNIGVNYCFTGTNNTEFYSINRWSTQNPLVKGSNGISALFLLKIVDSNKIDSVVYTYEASNTIVENEIVNQIQYSNDYYSAYSGTGLNVPNPNTFYKSTTTNSKRISKITSSETGAYIQFYYKNVQNNFGCDLLDYIIFYNKSGVVLKKYKLEYIYNGRYNISEVKLLDKNSQLINSYTLTYETGSIPDINSKSIDYYGYQNGANNSSFYPNTPKYYFENNNNRDVNFNYAKKGVLKSIKYPTGGITNFYYSSNQIRRGDTEGSVIGQKIHTYNEYLKHQANTGQSIGYSLTDTITITEDAMVNAVNGLVSVDIEYEDYIYDYDPNKSRSENFTGTMEIIGIDNSTIISIRSSVNGVVNGNVLQYNASPHLEKGRYKIIITTTKEQEMIGVKFSWLSIKNGSSHPNELINAGGLRVDKIEQITDGNIQVKEYSYTNGELLFIPKYIKEYLFLPSTGLIDCPYIQLSGMPLRQLGMSFGSYVTYENVKEINSDGSYIIHEFINSPIRNEWHAVKAPLFSNNHRKADASSKKYYDSNDNLIKMESYSYSYDLIKQLNGMYFEAGHGLNQRLLKVNPVSINEIFSYDIFQVPIVKKTLTSKSVTTYLNKDGILSSLTQATNYFYDGTEHLNPSRIVTSNSKGDIIETYMYYPEDYTSSDFTNLINNNITAIPVDKRTYVNNKLISGQLIDYNDNGQVVEVFNAEDELGTNLPFYASNPYSYGNSIVNCLYDSEANLSEVKTKGDVYTSYIWGYNDAYPIAKIENATYSQVSSYVSNLKNLSNLDVDVTTENNLRTALNNLRTSLPNAMITTYTYDPSFGITSITDPNGITTYYEYDNLGRLIYIKDHNKNILKKTQYNYAN